MICKNISVSSICRSVIIHVGNSWYDLGSQNRGSYRAHNNITGWSHQPLMKPIPTIMENTAPLILTNPILNMNYLSVKPLNPNLELMAVKLGEENCRP